jgi:ribonuclease E
MTETKPEGETEEEGARRRRGRRGGRRRREEGAPASPEQAMDAVQAMEAASRGYSAPGTAEGSESVTRGELASRYSGPTPADPFGGTSDGLLDAMEAAEAAAAEALAPKPAAPAVHAATPASPAPEADKAPAPEPVAAGEGSADEEAQAPSANAPSAAEASAEAAPIRAAPPQPDPVEPLVQNGSAAPEVVVGPAILPKSVEEIAASAPRRSGFWRR